MTFALKLGCALFALLFLLPLAISAARYRLDGAGADWRTADRSSVGLLPPARAHSGAMVRVFAAQTVRWRGIFAVHCWLVVKPEGTAAYTRYDYTAWGEPIRVNSFVPDGLWFGRMPQIVFAADGARAASLIPRMLAAIADYKWHAYGDYRAWPGPNSNTFVAAILAAVPEAGVALPPNAIGKDFPSDGRWVGLTPSRTGLRFTLDGYAGVSIGWVEGIEVNFLGGVVGIDIRRPALKLPGLGRIGLPAWTGETGETRIAAALPR
jgi:hypothetical protein